MAYHSHHMTIVGDLYCKLITPHLSPRTPKIPFYSSVTPIGLHEASDFGPRYWQDNLESPVMFHSAVRALLAGSKKCSVHLEVGPHAALSGPLRQIYNETSIPINYVSTLIRGKDDADSFLERSVSCIHLVSRSLTPLSPRTRKYSLIFHPILGTMKEAIGLKLES